MALSKAGKNQVDQSASLTVDGDLTVDTNTLYVDSTNNRVGIGTVSPASSGLDVTKAGGGNFVAQFTNTTSATPYGVWIKEPASAANGYPSLQVTDNAGTGIRFRVDSGTGYVTMPYQPAFEVRNNGDFTLPSGGEAKTIFTTVRNNRGNHYSTSTGRFTAPVSGTYLFTHCGSIYSSSQNPYLTTIFKKNGTVCSSYGRGSLSQSSGIHYGSAPLTAIVDMNANEYVELWCYSGATGAAFYNGEANFSGFLIG